MKRVAITYVLFTFSGLALLSCKKDDNTTPSPKVNTFEAIEDIATFHGNFDGDIVVVNTQGGPLPELDDDSLTNFINVSESQSALFVNVHQVQTKNPSQFTEADITFEEAKQYDLESVANLKRVVNHFKNQEGKTVYVLGISFGAFVTQELIALHGTDVADSFLIMVGRLNIDEGIWRPYSEGKFAMFAYNTDGNYTINLLGEGENVEDRNMARLAAGLGYNRYTERLNSINDLSKVTYVYGNRDEQVGPLSAEEVDFLKGKNAKVELSVSGTHGSAIDVGLRLLKETFGIK